MRTSIRRTLDYELEGVSFIDGPADWAISYRGLVFKTTNGGQTYGFSESKKLILLK